METKLTEQLSEVLQSKDASDLVDIIVELYRTGKNEAEIPQTRNERIAHLKEAFNRKIGPLEGTIKSIGGEIRGQAWINQTLQVRVPADKVCLLSEHDEVAKLDVPHPIVRDAIK